MQELIMSHGEDEDAMLAGTMKLSVGLELEVQSFAGNQTTLIAVLSIVLEHPLHRSSQAFYHQTY
jgi:hypothetical protein